MIVQELIDKLQATADKDREVVVYCCQEERHVVCDVSDTIFPAHELVILYEV